MDLPGEAARVLRAADESGVDAQRECGAFSGIDGMVEGVSLPG
jgi:hypothetical protein